MWEWIEIFIQQKLFLCGAKVLFDTKRSAVIVQITSVLCRDVILIRI